MEKRRNEIEIQDGVWSVIQQVMPRARAPGVLRLAFHDAGTFDLQSKSGKSN